MKRKTIQSYYLDLLAAWGEHPIDEEGVKEILHEIVADTVQVINALKKSKN